MKNKEFGKILEKFEMKDLKDFSINYLETGASEETYSFDEKTNSVKDAEIKVVCSFQSVI